jgi:hypothetical protein
MVETCVAWIGWAGPGLEPLILTKNMKVRISTIMEIGYIGPDE